MNWIRVVVIVQIIGFHILSGVVHALSSFTSCCHSFFVVTPSSSRYLYCRRRRRGTSCFRVQQQFVLSDAYLENDLVAVQVPEKSKKDSTSTVSSSSSSSSPRLCAVKPDGSVAPLCQRQDDVETDLFCDPREFDVSFWQSDDLTDDNIVNGTVFGEGYYGQRPVPSLGGGPGYGASADEIWSVDEEMLEKIRAAGVYIPILDMGIAHGEKARAGVF
jgi:hypothetical protein